MTHLSDKATRVNKHKAGLSLLWLTLLLVLSLPVLLGPAALIVLPALYLFTTWIVVLLSMIFRGNTR